MRTTTPAPKRIRLSAALLAVAAAGVGGYWMGTLPAKASSLDREYREDVKRATSATVGGEWFTERMMKIAAMREERDAMREKHPEFDQPGGDLYNADVALNEAQRALEAGYKSMMHEDYVTLRLFLRCVDRSLTDARGYIDRASK